MVATEAVRQIHLTPLDNTRLAQLCGQFDEYLHLIEKKLGVEINSRGNQFEIIGNQKSVDIACDALRELYEETSKRNKLINQHQIELMLKSLESEYQLVAENPSKKSEHDSVHLEESVIKPRTRNQRHYLNCIERFDINFGVGPSGTGKTFLAVACAVAALEQEKVSRIVLVRPAVEAGESLGFLPGDLAQKIDPYLRPLYDALSEMLGATKITKLMSKGVIEIAPLAYMRGRTLNDSFIIMDEGQNSTKEQMKMFLTRIGFGSKAVITGDVTQIDLPRKSQSGLRHAIEILRDIQEIQFTLFTSEDVVRHPLVQKIVEAYDQEVEEVQ